MSPFHRHTCTLSVHDLCPHQLLPYMYNTIGEYQLIEHCLKWQSVVGLNLTWGSSFVFDNDCLVWVELCCVVFGVSESEISLPAAKNTQRVSTCIVCVWVYGERVLNWRGEKERACEYRVKLRRWAQNPSIVWHTYLLNLSLRDVVQSG